MSGKQAPGEPLRFSIELRGRARIRASLTDPTGTAWQVHIATHGGTQRSVHALPTEEFAVTPGATGVWTLRVERDDETRGWAEQPLSISADGKRRLVRVTLGENQARLELDVELADDPRYSFLSAAERARRTLLEWYRDSSNPIVYQLVLGFGGGLMIGLFVGLLYFGTEAAQRLSGLGGTSLVGGVFYMLVRNMPELGGRDPQEARRRVYGIGITVAVTTFLAHAFAADVVPLPLDTPTARRVAQIEHDVALLTRPTWADERRVRAGRREWWVVPSPLRHTSHVQVQLLDARAEELEVIAVADDGRLLGGRRAIDTDEPLALQIRPGAAGRFHLAVRWRHSVGGSSARGPVTGAMVRVQSRSLTDEVQYLSAAPSAVTWRGERSEADGELSEDSDELGSLCGGAGDGERVYTIEIEHPSWVQLRVNGTAPSVAYLLEPRGARSAVWGLPMGEIACSVAEPRTREQSTSAMPANLELALNAGTYQVAIDGGNSGNAAFGIQLRRRPMTLPSRLVVDRVATIDLMHHCAATGCNGGEDGTVALAVRLEPGSYRWELLEFDDEADEPRSLAERDEDENGEQVHVSWADTREPILTVSAASDETLHLTPALGLRAPPVLEVRVRREVSPDEACSVAEAIASETIRRSTVSGSSPHGRFSGSVCPGPRDHSEMGKDAPEWIGALTIAEAGQYRIDVASHEPVDLVAYLFGGACGVSAVACDDDRDIGEGDDLRTAWDPRIDARLEPGTYYVVVDGYGAEDRGDFTLAVRRTSP